MHCKIEELRRTYNVFTDEWASDQISPYRYLTIISIQEEIIHTTVSSIDESESHNILQI